MDRDCKNCVYSNMTEHSNGCTRWDCEYINIDEAVKAWKFLHNNEKLKSIFEKYCDDCYSAGCWDCGYKPEAMAEFVDCAWRSDENGNGGDE